MSTQCPKHFTGFLTIFLFVAVMAITILFSGGCLPESYVPGASSLQVDINPDSVIWYDEPAAGVDDALIVGNGRLSAKVFGGVKKERIELSEGTLYCDGPHELDLPDISGSVDEIVEMIKAEEYVRADEFVNNNWFDREHQSSKVLGNLSLKFKSSGRAVDYLRKLDLKNAVAVTTFRQDGATFKREVFASNPDQVIVVRLTCDRPGMLNFSAGLSSVHPGSKITIAANDRIILSGQTPAISDLDENSGILFEAQLKVNAMGGIVQSDKKGIHVKDADSVTILISGDTNFAGFDHDTPKETINPSVATTMDIIQASAKAYQILLNDHILDYRELFDRVKISLDEAGPNGTYPTDVRVKNFLDRSNILVEVEGDEGVNYVALSDNSLAVLYFNYWRYRLISSLHGDEVHRSQQGPDELDGLSSLEGILNKMLLKSDGGDIHLLPALPAAWKEGKVKGLDGGAGFVADIKWKDGKFSEGIVRSALGNKCNIRYGKFAITRQSNVGEVIRLHGPLIVNVLKIGNDRNDKKVTHRFLKSGWKSGSVAIIAQDGTVEWEYGTDAETSDSWYLPGGKVIFSHKDGVTLVGKDKETIWTYDSPEGKENHTCQPIEDGRFLVGENGNGAWLVELNSDGTVYKKIKVSNRKDGRHAYRQIRKTPEGTYLTAVMTENKTYEWDADGKLLRTFPNGHFVAIRLDNGNTLTSGNPGKKGWHIAEFNNDGDLVWALNGDDDIGLHINMVCGLQRLDNGNTIVTNLVHGKDSNPDAPQVFEITPDKKVVWTVKDMTLNRIGSIQILDTDDGKIDNGKQRR